MTATMEVELDSRQRAPLAKVLGKTHRDGRYRVERHDDGTIVMTPVVSLSERELSVLARPELVAAIRQGVDQARAGNVVSSGPGHFTKLAEEMGIDLFAPDAED